MSTELVILDKYFKMWISGRKIEAAVLRSEAIRKMYFEEDSNCPVLRELISEESSDLEFRAETYSYDDWVEYHKRDNGNTKEFTRINTLLMLKFNKDIDFEKANKLHKNECQLIYKTQREVMFEHFLILHMTNAVITKSEEEGYTKQELLDYLLMQVELNGNQFKGLSEAVFAGKDLSAYEDAVASMSDDVVFDGGLNPDEDFEHKNSYMTLALAYLYLGKKEEAKRMLAGLEHVIQPTFIYYWTFRFLQKEIDNL